jgi:hypothetical protein
MSSEKRYIIKEFTGCAAILDSFYPSESDCLDGSSAKVKKLVHLPHYASGKCDNLPLRKSKLLELSVECNALNIGNSVTKQNAEEAINALNKAAETVKSIFPNNSYLINW